MRNTLMVTKTAPIYAILIGLVSSYQLLHATKPCCLRMQARWVVKQIAEYKE